MGREEEEIDRGMFYHRSGHNFSADCLSATDLDQIADWSQRMGFYRSRFQARWGEFISEWKKNQSGNWTPGPILLERTPPRSPGKCVGWNIAGGGLAKAATDMGVAFGYLYSRHTSVVEWANRMHGYRPYLAGGISLLGGSAQTEREAEQFKLVVQTYKPRVR